MTKVLSVLVMAFLGLSAGLASAADCTLALIAKAEETLPAAIALDAGVDPTTVLSKSYGCDFEAYEPWKGLRVSDDFGSYVGVISGIALDPAKPDTGVFWGYRDESKAKFAVPIASLRLYNFSQDPVDVVAIAPGSPVFTYTDRALYDKNGVKFRADILNLATLPPKDQSSAIASISDALPPGLGVYGDRSFIKVTSKPLGANIEVGGTVVGLTSRSFMIQTEQIGSLAISAVGYSRCQFSDGSYEPAMSPNGSATFSCQLHKAK